MEVWAYVFSWGSPLGLGMFLLLGGLGGAAFFWGISKLPQGEKTKKID